MWFKRLFWLMGLFLVGWVGTAVSTTAQTVYPDRRDLLVNDYANVIGGNHEESIRALLTEYHQSSGTEITVLTINSIQDYPTNDATIELFATNLFNSWGIGDATRNDGVLFLIAVEDRELRIEVGDGYSASIESRLQRIIDRDILPYFRNSQMSLGIYEGVRAIKADLAGEVYESLAESGGESTTTARSLTPTSTTSDASANSPWGWVAGGGVALLGGGGAYWRRRRRYAPRPCPACQTMMARLDELEDDEYLSEGEQEEERVGSVDYGVWLCPHCDHYEQHDYKSVFTKYKGCPQCGYRTSRTDSSVIRQPTYSSTGTREHRQTCRHCTLNKTWTTTIPRLERTQSSSSSSSFGSSSRSSSSRSSSRSSGGGRSSGRGASGKW